MNETERKQITMVRENISQYWKKALSKYPQVEIDIIPKQRKGKTTQKIMDTTHQLPPHNISRKNVFRGFDEKESGFHESFYAWRLGIDFYNTENEKEVRVNYFFIIQTGDRSSFFIGKEDGKRNNQWAQIDHFGFTNDSKGQIELVERVKAELELGFTKREATVIKNLEPRFESLEK